MIIYLIHTMSIVGRFLGDVVTFGKTIIFRFNHPKEAEELREKRKVSIKKMTTFERKLNHNMTSFLRPCRLAYYLQFQSVSLTIIRFYYKIYIRLTLRNGKVLASLSLIHNLLS